MLKNELGDEVTCQMIIKLKKAEKYKKYIIKSKINDNNYKIS